LAPLSACAGSLDNISGRPSPKSLILRCRIAIRAASQTSRIPFVTPWETPPNNWRPTVPWILLAKSFCSVARYGRCGANKGRSLKKCKPSPAAAPQPCTTCRHRFRIDCSFRGALLYPAVKVTLAGRRGGGDGQSRKKRVMRGRKKRIELFAPPDIRHNPLLLSPKPGRE